MMYITVHYSTVTQCDVSQCVSQPVARQMLSPHCHMCTALVGLITALYQVQSTVYSVHFTVECGGI